MVRQEKLVSSSRWKTGTVKASQLLFEDAVQPVELDLAVSLAAIYRANHVLRLRGQVSFL
jgi:hypothetical protein